MKSLLIILLAGYAVRCDDNNYYVVEMLDDPPTFIKPFKVYWNVPTMQCSSKKIYFENLYEKFGIIQNDNDQFKGDKVTILYDPGLFPALFINETSGNFRFRNGGVPQEGDLDEHLDAFKTDLDTSIPNTNFSGIGVIDFESWRPVFRQNFGVLVPYKNVSYEIETDLHWWWQTAWIESEAKRRFEEAARTFMQTTLSVAKQLRPQASWGFYGFPYCFNMASNNMVESCASNVPEENDQISWLWSESTALYPSIYSSASLSTAQLQALIRGRVQEAARIAMGDTILPYFWFRYRDAGYLSEVDLNMALATLYQSNASGIIIWGSSNDVNTVDKCNDLLDYVETVLGPAIAKYTKLPNITNDENNINTTTLSSNDVSTDSPKLNDTSNSDTKVDLDPEFYSTPPENYTENTITYVSEGINNTFSQNVTSADFNDTVLQNNSILVDLVLNPVLSSDYNESQPEDVGLVNSTTEINIDVTNTETRRIASNLLTISSSLNEINNTSSQVDSSIFDISPISIEPTTTDKIEVQSEYLDKSSLTSPIGIIESVSEITTTDKTNVNDVTEHYYEATLDIADDYEFNFDSFVNDYTPVFTDKYFTTESINENTKNTTENVTASSINSSESTKYINYPETDTTTEQNDKITGLSSNSYTTKNIDFNRTDTIATASLNQEIGIEAIETSTFNSELITSSTKTNKSEIANNTVSTTPSDLTNTQELSKTINNVSDSTRNLGTTEGSEATTTKIAEETTPIVPNSTEQVVVNY